MDDIVFENRNKKYGAYMLRQSTDKFMLRSLFAVSIIVCGLAAFSLKKKNVIPEATKEVVLRVEKIIPFIEPPKIDPPKSTQTIPLVEKTNTIKKVEFKPVDDLQKVNEKIITEDQLKGKAIDSKTVENGKDTGANKLPDENKGETGTGSASNGKNNTDFVLITDEMPQFGNSYEDIYKWLQKHIRYPQQAIDAAVEGKVYVSFIINTDGSVSDVSVIRGIGFGCDEEAMDAIKEMPKWKSGKQQGTPVRVKMTVPIDFKLSN